MVAKRQPDSSARIHEQAPHLPVASKPSTLNKLPKRKMLSILAQIQRMEKHNFPSNEAMAFTQDLLSKPNTSIMVIYEDEHEAPNLVAYAAWIRCQRRILLHKICVHSSFRKKGYGSHLLSEVVAQARKAFSPLDLWVDEARTPARKLYAKLGFVEMCRVENYYAAGRTGIKMSLEVEE